MKLLNTTPRPGFDARIGTRRATRNRPTRVDASDGRWRVRPGARLTSPQEEWVSRGGALTMHLSRLGKVSVRVVRESVAAPWRDEVRTMRGARRGKSKQVWTRDVVLSVDDVPCVAAHSITPLRESRGEWKSMRVLRTRPLAELLYRDRTVRRSRLVYRRLGGHADPLDGLLARAGSNAHDTTGVVARRSLFERRHAPLLITECFLPAFWSLLAARAAHAAHR
jgi:chorismate--pyruvate lyase